MDRSVDPCQDFYRYTCGNWMKTTKIPSSRSHYNIFSEINDQNKQKIKDVSIVFPFKLFYSSDTYTVCIAWWQHFGKLIKWFYTKSYKIDIYYVCCGKIVKEGIFFFFYIFYLVLKMMIQRLLIKMYTFITSYKKSIWENDHMILLKIRKPECLYSLTECSLSLTLKINVSEVFS